MGVECEASAAHSATTQLDAMATDCRIPSARELVRALAPGEFSWLLLETPYSAPQTGESLGSSSTLLLSIGDDIPVAARVDIAVRPTHGTTVRAGRTSAATHPHWPTALRLCTAPLDVAVVHVAEDSRVTAAEVHALIASLNEAGTMTVLYVDEDPMRRRATALATGCVLGRTGASLQVAAILADMVHAGVQSPYSLACLDLEDLLSGIGTAEQPGRLVEALWLRDEHRLMFFDREDEDVVREASAVVAHPVLGAYRLEELRAMWRAVQQRLGHEEVGLVYSGPVHPFAATWASTRAVGVRLLCRPRDQA
jgi:hypothetical protein